MMAVVLVVAMAAAVQAVAVMAERAAVTVVPAAETETVELAVVMAMAAARVAVAMAGRRAVRSGQGPEQMRQRLLDLRRRRLQGCDSVQRRRNPVRHRSPGKGRPLRG
ncbi:hypothetical protein ACNUI4_15815 [Pseudomonas aeruginosa]